MTTFGCVSKINVHLYASETNRFILFYYHIYIHIFAISTKSRYMHNAFIFTKLCVSVSFSSLYFVFIHDGYFFLIIKLDGEW